MTAAAFRQTQSGTEKIAYVLKGVLVSLSMLLWCAALFVSFHVTFDLNPLPALNITNVTGMDQTCPVPAHIRSLFARQAQQQRCQ